MQRKEINDTFFRVKKVSCFADVSKNNKIFSNYAIVNLDDNKIVSSVSDSFSLITNETLLDKIKSFTGLSAQFVYTDGKTFHYLTELYEPTENLLYGYEIINSYDGHTLRQCNIVYYHRKTDAFIFTDASHIIDIETSPKWTHINAPKDIWKKLSSKEKKLQLIFPADSPLIPAKYTSYTPTTVIIPANQAMAVLAFCPLLAIWRESNFLNARKFSIKLFNHYYNS